MTTFARGFPFDMAAQLAIINDRLPSLRMGSQGRFFIPRPKSIILKITRMKKSIAVLIGCAGMAILSTSTLSAPPEKEVLRLLDGQQGSDGLPLGWQPLTFPNISSHTQYSFIHEEGRPVIKAESHQSASGFYRPLNLNLHVYPILSWCWKVNHFLLKGDETTKEGDDYTARIYVTFRFDPDRATFWERTKYSAIKLFYGEYPPKRAMNYVWAGHAPVGKSFSNPYTDRAQMIVVESGEAKVGQWVCEERNLYEDYNRSFGEEPSALSGVAVMTDTDNTGEAASASYADLVLHPKREEKNR